MSTSEPLDIDTLLHSNSIRTVEDSVFLDLDVTPNSAQPGLKGYNRWRDRLIIKLRSRARKGQANTELIMLLSTILNIDIKQLSIIKGEHTAQKTVELIGLDRTQVINRIIGALNEQY